MATQVSILGRVRKLLEGFDQSPHDNENQPTLNEQLELLIAMGSSAYGEIVKIGRAFECHTTAALAAVVAVPTTANMLSLWNGEPDGGRCLIIDRVWALMVAGTAAAGQGAIIVNGGQTRVASLASAALAMNALNGNGGKDTKAINSTAVLDAITGVVANWRVAPEQTGGQKVGAGATPGVYINSNVNGRIIVPPGRLFAMHVMADLVGSTFTGGIEWHERYITVG